MRSFVWRYGFLLLSASLVVPEVNSQILAPSTVCKDQSFPVTTEPAPAGTFYWDFCEGDLVLQPTATERTADEFNIPVGTSLIEGDGKWYGFICSLSNNSLFRIDFGESLLNKTPAIVNLGNVGGLLNGPQDVEVIEFNSEYYAFVYNRAGNKLVRIDLGADVGNATPTAVAVLPGDGYPNGGLDVTFDGDDWIAATTNETNVTIAKLGDSPENIPPVDSILTTPSLPGISSIADIRFVTDGDEWFAFVIGYGSRTLHRFDFSAGLFSQPTATLLTSFQYSPYGLVVDRDNGIWVMHISTLQGNLLRIDLGVDPSDDDFILADLGTLGILNNLLKIDIANSLSRWVALTANWNSQSFYLIEFPQSQSGFDVEVASTQEHVIQSAEEGFFHISLRNKLANGLQVVYSEQIEVLSKLAPVPSFSSTSICENSEGVLTATADQPLVSVSWNLGSYGTSTQSEVLIQFDAPGVYPIGLEVVSENGCRNMIEKDIIVYPSISGAAMFDLPTQQICTQSETIIMNKTPDLYDGNLVYQWSIDDVLVGTERDLSYTFTTTGSKQIRLTTSIPGCSDDVTHTTTPVAAGPAVDFSFTGTCENDIFTFQGEIPDPVESFVWNFGIGETSHDLNAEYVFSNKGEYAVSLSATNALGCETATTKTIMVHSKPFVDFMVSGAPNACSGSETVFENATVNPDGRAIAEWLWVFGDPNDQRTSADAQAQHSYIEAGNYDVSLTATTTDGCSQTIMKSTTILPSAPAGFSHSAACYDVPVLFTASESEEIAWVYWEIGNSYYVENSPTHTFSAPGEYPLYLEVVSKNGCISSVGDMLEVPSPLAPDFSVAKNCAGEDAILADITDGVDAVVSRLWQFDNGHSSGDNPVTHVFDHVGSHSVSLTVTTQTGCSYVVNRFVEVVDPPVAQFNATPSSGAFPLEVTFVNTSIHTTTWDWDFNDGSGNTSTDASPVYTFAGPGTYNVELIAANPEGCTASSSTTITAVAPQPDVDIEIINISTNADGSAKLIVTINNKGNTVLKELPVDINVNGELHLRQIVPEPVMPSSQFNVVMNTSTVNVSSLRYICVNLDLAGDLATAGNEMCKQFASGMVIMPVYPNPSDGMLDVQWIAETGGVVRIAVIDDLGRHLFTSKVDGVVGLNTHQIDLSGTAGGLFSLIIDDGIARKIQRILITSRP